MKKALLFVLMLVVCSFGFAAKAPKTPKATKTAKEVKTLVKEYEGQYSRATNTFYYEKDRLVFPNKKMTYSVVDKSGLIDGIYQFMAEKYGVEDTDLINFKVVGTVSKDGVLTVTGVRNYRIPQERLNPGEYIPSTSGVSDIPGVTIETVPVETQEVRILDIPSIGPNK